MTSMLWYSYSIRPSLTHFLITHHEVGYDREQHNWYEPEGNNVGDDLGDKVGGDSVETIAILMTIKNDRHMYHNQCIHIQRALVYRENAYMKRGLPDMNRSKPERTPNSWVNAIKNNAPNLQQ